MEAYHTYCDTKYKRTETAVVLTTVQKEEIVDFVKSDETQVDPKMRHLIKKRKFTLFSNKSCQKEINGIITYLQVPSRGAVQRHKEGSGGIWAGRNHSNIQSNVPSPPGKPRIVKTESREVKVTWEKSATDNNSPISVYILHVSAGVGRTGMYILIDSMIAKMEDKGTINIPGFILHIRKQRNFLVQTEDQYMFIHDVLVEYIMGGVDTEVTIDTLTPYIEKLTMPARDGAETIPEAMLENQYKLVTAHKRNEDEISQALKTVNDEKNRNKDFLPVNLKRVLMPAKPGVDGLDYINATYLQGFSKSTEFIVTQHPLESTVEDFWKMVWDRNSPVIIVLYVNNEDYKEFWPKKDELMEFEACPFKLTTREEEEVSTCVTQGFLLESTQYDYMFKTKLMTVDGWPGACSPLHTVFHLIEMAQKWQLDNDIGPVIVVDRFGGMETGKLCALWTMYNQLKQDKSIDLYQLAKLYHIKRPGIIGTKIAIHLAMQQDGMTRIRADIMLNKSVW